MKKIKLITIACLSFIILTSCSNNDSVPSSDKKVITTMLVTFTTFDGGPTDLVLKYKDLDGDGPNPPEITVNGKLRSLSTYIGSILLLNETEDPAINISEQILAEAESHQFNFDFTPTTVISTNTGLNHPFMIEFLALSSDSNGDPFLSEFGIKPAYSGTGILTIKLRSQIDKTLTNSGMVYEGGQVEIEAAFEIPVEDCGSCWSI